MPSAFKLDVSGSGIMFWLQVHLWSAKDGARPAASEAVWMQREVITVRVASNGPKFFNLVNAMRMA
ncbi:MAG: hypothetical protein JO165_01475 [Candidatus Eremiobacteraeota bacterium]|nr:hypothetical protein [Candidatus Eremiobacteraeota bacterium]